MLPALGTPKVNHMPLVIVGVSVKPNSEALVVKVGVGVIVD